jgi:hypothetical protein
MRFSRLTTDGGAGGSGGPGRSPRGRNARSLKAGCESLDGRQLLSTAAGGLPTPPAAAVANAAADLNTLDPTTFAQYQRDLAQAASHSRVTPAQAGALAQDEAAIDQAIDAAGLTPDETKGDVNKVQNVFADAFLAGPFQASAAANRRLDQEIARIANSSGQAVDLQAHTRGQLGLVLRQTLAGVPGATALIPGTVSQMEVVARAARVSPPLRTALALDRLQFEYELGPKPDTDLGPGAVDRDPLYVYGDGQVNSFIKG